MGGSEIPDNLRLFLFECVDSVEVIEVLLYLRSHGDQGSSAETICQELRSSLMSVTNRLNTLRSIGLVVEEENNPGKFQYKPRTPDLDEIVTLLADEYKTRRHKVLELVFSSAKRARKFADAFMVTSTPSKKGEKDG